jgi:hypothetical protein
VIEEEEKEKKKKEEEEEENKMVHIIYMEELFCFFSGTG